MFYSITNPPQWMLDGLLNEEKKTSHRNCPDCSVKVNEKHLTNCDVARCTVCSGQLLSCGCDNGSPDVWTGLWPGVVDAYELKLVCFDTATMTVCFDLNETFIRKVVLKK